MPEKYPENEAHMYTVATAGVDVALCIDLDTVWNSGVCVRKDAAVGE